MRDIFLVFDTWDRTVGNIIDPDLEKQKDVEMEIPVTVSASVVKKSDRKKIQKEKLNEVYTTIQLCWIMLMRWFFFEIFQKLYTYAYIFSFLDIWVSCPIGTKQRTY